MDGTREIVRHFTYDELKCKCGHPECEGLPPLGPEQMSVLRVASVLRDALGFPIICTSYYRCNKHPQYRKASAHSNGMAIDLRPVGASVNTLYLLAEGHFLNGLGLQNKWKKDEHFIHIDQKAGRVARWYYERTMDADDRPKYEAVIYLYERR